MGYLTRNEIENFDFSNSYIGEMHQDAHSFYLILDNVVILSSNSTNRDIRNMRANDVKLTIADGAVISLIEEGYKVYDADGNLSESFDDKEIVSEEYNEVLKSLENCTIYSISKNESVYDIEIDTEDHTYSITVKGTGDTEEWEKYLSPTDTMPQY